jgi:uncharacterized SAM-binding protein YcdF (DUF218 family)
LPIRPRTPPRSRTSLLRHWTLWAWFALAVALSVGGMCLWRSGRWLVREDAFFHAEWAAVLAGESRDCERTDAAIRLLQEGRIDTLVLSATRIFKNRYQSEFMLDYVLQQGVPRERVFEFRQDAYSTQEEARLLIRQFRLQNLDTVLIITSNFHTARARRIFRKLANGFPVVLMASADYPLFDPAAWWSNRESRKIWLDEWEKTIHTAFELWQASPETGQAEYQGLTPDPTAGSGSGSPTAPETPLHGSKDSATAHRAAENGAGTGAEPEPQARATDSLKSGGASAGPADSAKAAKDSAGAEETRPRDALKAAEGKSAKDPKDSAGLAANRAEPVAGTAGNPPESPKAPAETAGKSREAEAKKAPAHTAAKKPAVPPAKPVPKREEKKADKPKKKG